MIEFEDRVRKRSAWAEEDILIGEEVGVVSVKDKCLPVNINVLAVNDDDDDDTETQSDSVVLEEFIGC